MQPRFLIPYTLKISQNLMRLQPPLYSRIQSVFLKILQSQHCDNTMPGSGHRLQPSVLQALIDYLAAGENNSEVSQNTGITCSTIAKIQLSLEYWGVAYSLRCVHFGRPRSLRPAQVLNFKEYLDGKPGAYLEEMRDFWYDEFDVQVNVSTVYQ
jgi:hypothetical protein